MNYAKTFNEDKESIISPDPKREDKESIISPGPKREDKESIISPMIALKEGGNRSVEGTSRMNGGTGRKMRGGMHGHLKP